MEEQKCLIQCDECKNVFDIRNTEIKTKENVRFENKTFSITYFKCEKCRKVYIVEMLDFKAEKMKNRYLNMSESVKKKKQKGLKVSDDRLKELERTKQDAIIYQHWLVENYRIPQELYVE
jgi:hypothetical protein